MKNSKKSGSFRNEMGLTLIEVLVSVGILAIVSLGVGAMIKTIFNHEATLVNKTESNEFVNSLSKWLQSSAGCASALTNVDFPTGTNETQLTINGYNGYGATTGVPIQSGFKVSNQLTLKNLVVKDKGVAPVPMEIASLPYTRKIAQIKIDFEVNVGGTKTEMRTRFIELPVLIKDPGPAISQCHVETSLEESCTSMGGTYNAGTGLCTPQKNCIMRGTYIKLTCAPAGNKCQQSFSGSYNNPITKTASCPTNSSPAMTGRFIHTHQVGCGKKCSYTVTDTEDFFVCMQCN